MLWEKEKEKPIDDDDVPKKKEREVGKIPKYNDGMTQINVSALRLSWYYNLQAARVTLSYQPLHSSVFCVWHPHL